MSAEREIWVFSEKNALCGELLAGARQLAGESSACVAALIIGSREKVVEAIALGADKVYWLGEQGQNLIEDFLPTLVQMTQAYHPPLFMIGASKRGKLIAGRLAVHLATSVVTDIKNLELKNGELLATHLIFGGGAVRVEKARVFPLIVTIGMSIYQPNEADSARKGEVVEQSFTQPGWRVTLKERKQKPPSSVNLAAAKRVVCPGRGVQKEEDLGMVRELAQTLEAEVGCTRPLAEGLDWLPREAYIGVSGAFIKPDLYIGLGVSGQVQHTVGITESKIVVGINKDKTAAMFQQSDYGIEGDLYQVVPVLIKALKSRK